MAVDIDRTRLALSLLLSMPPLLWTADLLASTPPIILAAATAPAMLLAALILFAQRRARRPRAALALTLLWGAVGAAFLATMGNDLSRAWMTGLAGDDARTATALLIAPALEEAAKALGLVLLVVLAPAAMRNARDGIVYGALIGVGFVWTENFLYLGVSMLQGGEEGLLRGLYLRGILGGATHTVFTACSGAAFGWWLSRRIVRGPADGRAGGFAAAAGGLALAIGQHAVWNAVAAPLIVNAICGASTFDGACTGHPANAVVFGVTTTIAAVFLAPGIALSTLAWRSGGDERIRAAS